MLHPDSEHCWAFPAKVGESMRHGAIGKFAVNAGLFQRHRRRNHILSSMRFLGWAAALAEHPASR